MLTLISVTDVIVIILLGCCQQISCRGRMQQRGHLALALGASGSAVRDLA